MPLETDHPYIISEESGSSRILGVQNSLKDDKILVILDATEQHEGPQKWKLHKVEHESDCFEIEHVGRGMRMAVELPTHGQPVWVTHSPEDRCSHWVLTKIRDTIYSISLEHEGLKATVQEPYTSDYNGGHHHHHHDPAQFPSPLPSHQPARLVLRKSDSLVVHKFKFTKCEL